MFFLVLVELFVRRNGQKLAPFKVPADQTILQLVSVKLWEPTE